MQEILDAPPSPKPSITNQKLLIAIGVLMVVNILVHFQVPLPTRNVSHLDGSPVSADEIRYSIFKTVVFAIPVLSFVLSLLFSLIPYKNWGYGNKLKRLTLWMIVVCNALILIGMVDNFF